MVKDKDSRGRYADGPSRFFRDNLITLELTQADHTRLLLYRKELGAEQGACLNILHANDVKLSLTPARGEDEFYLSLTWKRPGAYLQGFTVSVPNVNVDWCLYVAAWIVEITSGLLPNQVDAFLDFGSGTFEEPDPERPENSATEDDIPF